MKSVTASILLSFALLGLSAHAEEPRQEPTVAQKIIQSLQHGSPGELESVLSNLTEADHLQVIGEIRGVMKAKKAELDSLAEKVKTGNYNTREAIRVVRNSSAYYGGGAALVLVFAGLLETKMTMERQATVKESLEEMKKGEAPLVEPSPERKAALKEINEKRPSLLSDTLRVLFGSAEDRAELEAFVAQKPDKIFVGYYAKLFSAIKSNAAKAFVKSPFETILVGVTGVSIILLAGSEIALAAFPDDGTEKLAEDQQQLLKQIQKYQTTAAALASALDATQMHVLLNQQQD
ncbi:MAG: hypothetical protein C5B49_12840 [Bdellovibrio sp.]|nr:MAG: hypothetical protein C5B49_12840 [Bdellovibrio sp.]